MSTLPVPAGSFVPSRFLKRQLYAIAVGAAVTHGALTFWPQLTRWFLAKNFLPHPSCYLGNPRLVWTNLATDSVVGFAYLAISATLGYLGYKKRRAIPSHWLFLPFGLLMLSCSGTQLIEVAIIRTPVYNP